MTARRLTAEQKQDLLRLYEKGTKVRTIARQFGVGDCYPTELAKRRGLALRQPHAPARHRRVR